MNETGFQFQTYYFDDPPQAARSLDVFPVMGEPRPPAMLFVHGGGWRGGTKTIHHPIMYALANKGYACAAVDYRLAGVTAKEQVADVREGWRLFAKLLTERGRDGPIVLMGGSAGAHLALLAGMMPGDSPDFIPPAGIVSTSGPVTFEPWEEMFPPIWASMRDIAGRPHHEAPELYTELSPMHWVGNATPPICLLNGDNDHMFPQYLAGQFVARMRACGRTAEHHVYEHAEHGFFYDVTRRCQQQAFADLQRFLLKLES